MYIERDCDNCAHKTPKGCSSWKCEYINRKEAIAAWREKDSRWTDDEVAMLLYKLLGDKCACNFGHNDEWLAELCEYKDSTCPNPEGVECWKQYVIHMREKL